MHGHHVYCTMAKKDAVLLLIVELTHRYTAQLHIQWNLAHALLSRSPMGQKYVAVIERWLLIISSVGPQVDD